MPALWWAELYLVLLLGRAMPRSVFWCVCDLSMSLGILSADECVCVPVLKVVWPEAFQDCSLQAVGWGWVLVPKWGPAEDLMLGTILWDLYYQSPCPHSDLQPPPSSPGDPPRLLGRSNPGSYGGTALCFIPVHVRPCAAPPVEEIIFSPLYILASFAVD